MSCCCLSHCGYAGLGQLCSSLGGPTSKDLPGSSQLGGGDPWAQTEGTISSSSQQRPPQQGSLAVMHALLLLSRVGEWVQLVCWIGIGWSRAASPAQGYKGPELGSWPSSWLLPRGQRSARSAAQCWEGSGWACSAALLSGTATSPWEVQGTCNIWWELGRKEQCCIYAPQLAWFFFFSPVIEILFFASCMIFLL